VAYPAAPVVAVVCENAIIHHSKIVQRWLAAHPRVRVLHGARYSPHDNPTERIWAALKAWLAKLTDADHPGPHPSSPRVLPGS
jgi:transposase